MINDAPCPCLTCVHALFVPVNLLPQAAFADMQSQQDAASKTGGSTKSWPRTLPEHSTATFVQLMLLHNTGWPSANIWQRWQAAHTEGSLAICSHLKVCRPCGNSAHSGAVSQSPCVSRCRLQAC
jgi:hypothetical protein